MQKRPKPETDQGELFVKSPRFHLNFPFSHSISFRIPFLLRILFLFAWNQRDTLPGNGGDRRGIASPRLQDAFSSLPEGLAPAALSLHRTFFSLAFCLFSLWKILFPVMAFRLFRYGNHFSMFFPGCQGGKPSHFLSFCTS